ncbi:MAG: DUF2029 domain-containing protein [Gemmatimonadetes bacterium]|nr:DUF2029 domain-containing protein [Gemmatimonadota bacterium]
MLSRLERMTAVLWIVAAMLGVRLAILVSQRVDEPAHGFVSHYAAARLLTEGADVAQFYDDSWFEGQVVRFEPTVTDVFGANMPTMSLLMVPLTILDYRGARVVWTAVSLLLLIATSVWLVRSLNIREGWVPGFFCFVFLYQPVYENLSHGQMYVLVLVLLSLAWQGYSAVRAGLLGTTLGALFVTKTAALMMWPLLLVQRQWRALMLGAVTILVVAVGSLPVMGINVWKVYLGKAAALPSNPLLAVTAYQTQLSFFRHLFVFQDPAIGEPIANLPFLGAVFPWIGVAVLLGISAFVAYRCGKSDLIFAAFVLISLILSPVSLDYHYVIALLPIAILLADLQKKMVSRDGLVLMAGALLIGADLPYRALRLTNGAWALFAYPKLYGGLLLWGLALTRSLRGFPSAVSQTVTRQHSMHEEHHL